MKDPNHDTLLAAAPTASSACWPTSKRTWGARGEGGINGANFTVTSLHWASSVDATWIQYVRPLPVCPPKRVGRGVANANTFPECPREFYFFSIVFAAHVLSPGKWHSFYAVFILHCFPLCTAPGETSCQIYDFN